MIIYTDTTRFRYVQEVLETIGSWNPEDDYMWPFNDLKRALIHQMIGLRTSLINTKVENLRKMLVPNIPTEKLIKFNNHMDAIAGQGNFDEAVIEDWFKQYIQDEEYIREVSLNAIVKKAESVSGGGYRAKADAFLSSKGTVLELRAYTWDTGYNISYINCHNWREDIDAFEKLLDIIVYNADPLTVKGSLGVHQKVSRLRDDPDEFYKRHETPHHSGVEWYQFFKNGKLKMKFKNPIQARMIAEEIEYKEDA